MIYGTINTEKGNRKREWTKWSKKRKYREEFEGQMIKY